MTWTRRPRTLCAGAGAEECTRSLVNDRAGAGAGCCRRTRCRRLLRLPWIALPAAAAAAPAAPGTNLHLNRLAGATWCVLAATPCFVREIAKAATVGRGLPRPLRDAMPTFHPRATGGHGASTNAVYYLFTKHLRDSGVPGEAPKSKPNKDISFALRRGTSAQVTTLLALYRRASDEPAQRAAEAELTRWLWPGRKPARSPSPTASASP